LERQRKGYRKYWKDKGKDIGNIGKTKERIEEILERQRKG
jgi:hypothetical protein